MKKTLLSATAIALVFAAGSALAADLPAFKSPPPPPPPPPPMWTGFYAGANAGYTWSRPRHNPISVWSIPTLPGPGVAFLAAQGTGGVVVRTDGFIGGGQIGYNYQFGARIVVGLEADIQGFAGVSGTGTQVSPSLVPSVLTTTRSVDYLGTVRARAGFLLTPSLLVYGTGGLAFGGVNTSTSLFQFIGPSVGAGIYRFSDTRVGWTAGGGLEWMFMPNLSAKVEYLYYDLGSVSHSAITSVMIPFVPYAVTRSTARYAGHVVRAGLNYHLNWGAPAPVYASY